MLTVNRTDVVVGALMQPRSIDPLPAVAGSPAVHGSPGDTDAWICLACGTSNPAAAAICAGCGRRFADQFETARPLVSQRLRSIALGARELGIVFVLYLLWQLGTGLSLTHSHGAFARARAIWRLERDLHLPSEVWVQRAILAHHTLVRALDLFYLSAHVGSLAIFLPWLFLLHRDHYKGWRNVLVGVTAISLAIQLVSIAPPRLLPSLGFVDTATRYHQSVYTGLGSGLTDQLSTMPSIHVAWAVIVACAVVSVSRNRYRWWVIAHPILTVYVVVATANHFWLDAAAATVIVGVVLAIQRALIARRTNKGTPNPRFGST